MTKMTADWLTDPKVQAVCAVLTDAGFQAWFVGGCVRNTLLGAPVSDLDLCTDAHPDKTMKLAQAAGYKVIPTGIDHGTVTIVAEGTPLEITTFRRDVATDGRRATVAFADNIEDDARRRDFTINALYAAPDGTVADPLGGLPDLHARQIKFIEDPEQRIKEDYLRILRFFRFYAWYGDPKNGPDPDALAACAANNDGLLHLSKERISGEIFKLLAAPDPAPAVAAMAATGALAQVLPGAVASVLAVLVHVEQAAHLQPDPLRRLVALGGDMSVSLRLSKREVKQIQQLQSNLPPSALGYHFGLSCASDVLAIRAAAMGSEIDPRSLEQAAFGAEQIFPLSAADFMPALKGAALGAALEKAKTRWIKSEFRLTKAELLE